MRSGYISRFCPRNFVPLFRKGLITAVLCYNASGTHKLHLFVIIGKTMKYHAFKNRNMTSAGHRNHLEWMDFCSMSGFKYEFVP